MLMSKTARESGGENARENAIARWIMPVVNR